MYDRKARYEETERMQYEREMGSGDGQRNAERLAKHYRRNAEYFRARGQ